MTDDENLWRLSLGDREAFEWVRGLAGLKQIEVRLSFGDTSAPRFTVLRYGAPTYCADLAAVREQLQALGVPMIDAAELRRRANVLGAEFERAAREAADPPKDH